VGQIHSCCADNQLSSCRFGRRRRCAE